MLAGAASLANRRNRAHADEFEFLNAPIHRFERRDFGGVEIALLINRKMMQGAELPGVRAPGAERIEELQRLALEDPDLRLASVGDVQVLLRGVGRKSDAR